MVVLYVYATTNALREEFITSYLSSFDKALLFHLFFIVGCIIFSVFGTYNQRKILLKTGLSNMISSIIITSVGLIRPCYLTEYVERIEVYKTLEKSFLCPSFNLEAYFGLLTNFFFGLILTIVCFVSNIRPKKEEENHLPPDTLA